MADGIIFTAGTLRTLSYGDVRLTINIDKADAKAVMELFGTPGTTGVVVRISPEAAQKDMQDKAAHPYGQQARALRLSGFFRSPEVWRAIGTDADFLDWVREQKCCIAGCGAGLTEAAHVRRVANGAGVGIKPEYSAIPLCPHHHREQHQRGESAIGGKDVVDRLRIEAVTSWAWDHMKKYHLNAESMGDVPPEKVYDWAQFWGVEKYLPEEYGG